MGESLFQKNIAYINLCSTYLFVKALFTVSPLHPAFI